MVATVWANSVKSVNPTELISALLIFTYILEPNTPGIYEFPFHIHLDPFILDLYWVPINCEVFGLKVGDPLFGSNVLKLTIEIVGYSKEYLVSMLVK